MRISIPKMAFTICLLSNLVPLDVGIATEPSVSARTTTIEGRITFQGSLPRNKESVVTRDSEYCGTSITTTLVARDSHSNGIKDVVVSIEGIDPNMYLKSRQRSIPLANQKCQFTPRVQAVYRGSSLKITNVDPVLHNTHIQHERTTFLNVVVPSYTRPIIKRLFLPGLLNVRCDAHKFMEASIHVFSHPYFALTDKEGKYKIHHIPPGTYQLKVWHQFLGVQTQTIRVSAEEGQTVHVDIDMKK